MIDSKTEKLVFWPSTPGKLILESFSEKVYFFKGFSQKKAAIRRLSSMVFRKCQLLNLKFPNAFRLRIRKANFWRACKPENIKKFII
jgi:hypothetical protein